MFKKLILAIMLIFFVASSASAVTLAWDANTDNPTGYQVYFRLKGGTDVWNTAPILHPTTTVIVDDKYLEPEVIYEFWAIAYGKSGTSGPSNILEYTRPGYQPPGANLPAEYIITLPQIPENFN